MILLFLIFTFFLSCSPILASERNIFGLHLTQTSDIYSAAKIINSQSGDWGYATIVIRLDQLNHQTWQEFMNNCRKLHIIPIVRLSTIMENGYWKLPTTSDIDNLTSFLNSLNWPTTDQHVILFNEVNHGSEWGGQVDPKSFADLSIYTYQKLKQLNPNFLVISTALDLAAPNQKNDIMSAPSFYQQIYSYKPEYFENIDAIGSHSYPNHGYVGLPTDSGQHSIRGYIWEQSYLKKLGVKKNYPVYITETGWPHREGELTNNNYYVAQTAAKLLLQAYKFWQSDSSVRAVTPFIYNYPHEPFDHFSWLDKSENLISAYQKVVDLPKNKNIPSQTTSYQITQNHLPMILLTNNEYLGEVSIKNTGQSIWGETNFCLPPESSSNITIDQICTSAELVPPGQTEKFSYKISIKDDKNLVDQTYIKWKDLPRLDIVALNGEGTIYSPKTTMYQKIILYLQSLFI